MKALTITKFGGPDVLQLLESPDPSPNPGDVRIRVMRAGLNFAEVAARVGLYPDAGKAPMVAGYEVAGTIDVVGQGVSGWKVGDRVLALVRFGAHATHVVVNANQVQKIPEKLTYDEAAALPVNYLTAFHMLFHVFNLRPKQRVLLHMAAGGVGLAVIQLSKLVADVEIFGTASASKHPMLRELGVAYPIDYRAVDYVKEVKGLTNGKGVDLVLDALGGADWQKGYDLLKPAGHLIAFGWANMITGEKRNLFRVVPQMLGQPKFTGYKMMNDNRTVSGVNLGHLWTEVELLNGHLQRLLELCAEGKVKPHVDKVFPLSEGPEAHRYLQARKNVGKVVFDCTT